MIVLNVPIYVANKVKIIASSNQTAKGLVQEEIAQHFERIKIIPNVAYRKAFVQELILK